MKFEDLKVGMKVRYLGTTLDQIVIGTVTEITSDHIVILWDDDNKHTQEYQSYGIFDPEIFDWYYEFKQDFEELINGKKA